MSEAPQDGTPSKGIMSVFFAVFCMGAVALLLAAEYSGQRRLKWLTKPAASAAFIGLALSEGALGAGAFGLFLLAGLVLCAAGDVLLIPRAERWFLAGMGAFALGHGAYIAAFLSQSPQAKPLVFAAALAMIVVGAAVLRTLWGKLGPMRAPVAVYIAIISAMVIASVAASPVSGGYAWALVAGAVGFAASDIAVARDQFIAQSIRNKLWGLPLYYGSQLVLAASV